MTRIVVVPSRVESDLRSVVAWYRTTSGSDAVAKRWHDGVVAAIETLGENPRRGVRARESDQLDFELFELSYGSGRRRTHRILYRFDDDLGRVLAIVSYRLEATGPIARRTQGGLYSSRLS